MITIKKNQVIYNSYNEEPEDITEHILFHLMEPTKLDDDITLKDIFILMENNIDILQGIIGNWIDEIVQEGLHKEQKPYSNQYNKDELEYLELYKHYDIDEPDGFGHINFHGVGFILQEEHEYMKEGDRINWSLSFSAPNDIINIPLKLNNNIKIYKDDKVLAETKSDSSLYTLIEIFYHIIWELSFHGSPSNRDETKDMLNQRVKDYHENKDNYKIMEL